MPSFPHPSFTPSPWKRSSATRSPISPRRWPPGDPDSFGYPGPLGGWEVFRRSKTHSKSPPSSFRQWTGGHPPEIQRPRQGGDRCDPARRRRDHRDFRAGPRHRDLEETSGPDFRTFLQHRRAAGRAGSYLGAKNHGRARREDFHRKPAQPGDSGSSLFPQGPATETSPGIDLPPVAPPEGILIHSLTGIFGRAFPKRQTGWRKRGGIRSAADLRLGTPQIDGSKRKEV